MPSADSIYRILCFLRQKSDPPAKKMLLFYPPAAQTFLPPEIRLSLKKTRPAYHADGSSLRKTTHKKTRLTIT